MDKGAHVVSLLANHSKHLMISNMIPIGSPHRCRDSIIEEGDHNIKD